LQLLLFLLLFSLLSVAAVVARAVAYSSPTRINPVISTEGGAFAAAVERPASRFCRCLF
jgi:hypothetical protein